MPCAQPAHAQGLELKDKTLIPYSLIPYSLIPNSHGRTPGSTCQEMPCAQPKRRRAQDAPGTLGHAPLALGSPHAANTMQQRSRHAVALGGADIAAQVESRALSRGSLSWLPGTLGRWASCTLPLPLLVSTTYTFTPLLRPQQYAPRTPQKPCKAPCGAPCRPRTR